MDSSYSLLIEDFLCKKKLIVHALDLEWDSQDSHQLRQRVDTPTHASICIIHNAKRRWRGTFHVSVIHTRNSTEASQLKTTYTNISILRQRGCSCIAHKPCYASSEEIRREFTNSDSGHVCTEPAHKRHVREISENYPQGDGPRVFLIARQTLPLEWPWCLRNNGSFFRGIRPDKIAFRNNDAQFLSRLDMSH